MFTLVLSAVLLVTSAVLLASSVAGLRYSFAVQKFSGELGDDEIESLIPVALEWATWSAVTLFLLMFTGILVIVWTNTASRSFDNRGPIGRRWRGGWTIGAWFIPIGNLVLPKLVFNEIERIARVPYQGIPIGEEWRRVPRSQLGDLWWLLWIGGVIPSQLAQIVVGAPTGDAGQLAIVLSINAFTYALFAGAGVLLALHLWRIEQSSQS